ncbi:hypothetical protein EIN_112840 [Entamoeba invadens IP1]|uniref:EF-hand domain-containing protein n=1 Tax=Entamoeba invadens IP1 TaxID=370355 RepID=A0A0A1TXV7_ENTIV|nr:hypothetical protein EIN_112840 [Entamoeba invadens IP1]ELP86250.1 hypothetical protein EIN_112840 [Entamoeba invadens IP1]|eukprot:XP_004185596.1 hypothetical protein EIN_112840 [Entamoeba invadens IP1]
MGDKTFKMIYERLKKSDGSLDVKSFVETSVKLIEQIEHGKSEEYKFSSKDFPESNNEKTTIMVEKLAFISGGLESSNTLTKNYANILVNFLEKLYNPNERQKMRHINKFMFECIDSNHDGVLSKDEFKKFIQFTNKEIFNKEENEQKISELFDKTDINNDGMISFEEFQILLKTI